MSKTLCGAILAAGHGTRMQPFSERYPKPLLPVCNKPLIVHHVEFMRSIGIRKIAVLIGHKGYEIAKVLGDGKQWGVEIRYVEQRTMLGIGHAVGLLEPEIQDPFLLFLGDIYFTPKNFQSVLDTFESRNAGGVLVTKEEDDVQAIRKNFAILQNADGQVVRVIEKPRHAPNKLKGVGIYMFDPAIFDAIRRTPRTALRDEYELTDAIQVMIDDGYRVYPESAIRADINLTTPADLLRANLLHAQEIDPASAMGENVRRHPESRIANSVVGQNAEIETPIEIRNSLVFPGTKVQSTAPLDRAIVTPHGLVDCRPWVELSQVQPAEVHFA
jgi:dTDP-glucose pyrophosphorylase